MKTIKLMMIALMMCLFVCVFSQTKTTKTTNISKLKIGEISWKFCQEVDLSENDTTYYLLGGFQNYKYSYITDIQVIFITNQTDLDEFIKDLITVYSEMNKKQIMSWYKKRYILRLSDFTDYLSIGDGDGKGYTYITYKQVEKTIKFLETIKLK